MVHYENFGPTNVKNLVNMRKKRAYETRNQ